MEMSAATPPPYRAHAGRRYIDSWSLRTSPTEKPDADAIGTLRFFFTSCLLRDYGLIGYNNMQFNLQQDDVGDIFFRLFEILGNNKAYAKRGRAQHWKKYLAYNFDETVKEIGIPMEIARNMLCLFDWTVWYGNLDRFQEYRTYARSIDDIAEKIYFDREVIIDAVVEPVELRSLLKERLQFIEKTWFLKLDGPCKGYYTLSYFAENYLKRYWKPWKPAAVRPDDSLLSCRFMPPYTLRKRLRYWRWLRSDMKCRESILAGRKPPGTPKDYWPAEFRNT